MIEVIYPNDDDPRKEKDPLVEIDSFLEAKTRVGDEVPDIRTLASNMGIGSVDLRALVNSNPEFKRGLERVRKFFDENLEDNDPWNNRIDVSLVRLLLSDFKPNEKKE